MKRNLITTGVLTLVISQIFFVFGQPTTTSRTVSNPTPPFLTSSSLPISTSLSSPSPSISPISKNTTNPSTNSTLYPVIYPYNTVQVPPNNGTWQICAQQNTSYVSYSIRVIVDSSPITPNYGTTTDSQLNPDPTAPVIGVVARIIYSNGLEFIPSLSCYTEVVTACDQDAGTILMKDKDKYCLQIVNPGQYSQNVNVTVSFNRTVFKNGGFTSEDKPGGNTQPLNNNPGSGASVNCKSTSGVFVILTMLWLAFDIL